MTNKLTKINQSDLELHQKWLDKDPDGQRIVVAYGADLRWADLRGANLRGADLRWADLQEADLRDANLDFSCLPLWCGSKGIKVDRRIAAQLVAHVCALSCDDEEFQALRKLMLPFARTSHRAEDLGLLADALEEQLTKEAK